MLSPCTHPTGRDVMESPGLPVIPGTGGTSQKDLGIVMANLDMIGLLRFALVKKTEVSWVCHLICPAVIPPGKLVQAANMPVLSCMMFTPAPTFPPAK